MPDYTITTTAGRHNNHWLVTRDDGKIMTGNLSVFTCLRWVATWGGVDLGR